MGRLIRHMRQANPSEQPQEQEDDRRPQSSLPAYEADYEQNPQTPEGDKRRDCGRADHLLNLNGGAQSNCRPMAQELPVISSIESIRIVERRVDRPARLSGRERGT